MERSFGLVNAKVKEVEYFLCRILDDDYYFFDAQRDAVVFTAAARRITFAVQASLERIPELMSGMKANRRFCILICWLGFSMSFYVYLTTSKIMQ